jgi:hypothetical protein
MSDRLFSHSGYPSKEGCPHFALYQPFLDRFLLITDDKKQSLKIKVLAMPRYPLVVMQIDQAHNYQFNLIDNVVCENWTLVKEKYTDFWNLSDYEPRVVTELIPAASVSQCDVDVQLEKEWLQFCWYWIRFTDYLLEHSVRCCLQKNLISGMFPELGKEHQYHMRELNFYQNKIYKFLFLERDQKTCHNEITGFIKSHSMLEKVYTQWSDSSC